MQSVTIPTKQSEQLQRKGATASPTMPKPKHPSGQHVQNCSNFVNQFKNQCVNQFKKKNPFCSTCVLHLRTEEATPSQHVALSKTKV